MRRVLQTRNVVSHERSVAETGNAGVDLTRHRGELHLERLLTAETTTISLLNGQNRDDRLEIERRRIATGRGGGREKVPGTIDCRSRECLRRIDNGSIPLVCRGGQRRSDDERVARGRGDLQIIASKERSVRVDRLVGVGGQVGVVRGRQGHGDGLPVDQRMESRQEQCQDQEKHRHRFLWISTEDED